MAVCVDSRIYQPSPTSAVGVPRSLPAQRRLRRRRRVTALVVMAAVCFVAGMIAGVIASSGAGAATVYPPVQPEATLVIVQPGDTLWSIARDLQPDGDVRRMVDALSDIHGGGVLHVGDRLFIPAGLARG